MENLFRKINRHSLSSFRQYLAMRGASHRSIKRKESSLKKFFSWAAEKGYLAKNPFGDKTKRFTLSLPKGYRALPYFTYLNFLILLIFLAALGFGIYQQFILKAPEKLAYPAAETRPKRYLSFQGRLTDSTNTPLVEIINFQFKLYDLAGSGTPPTGGTLLWDSGSCPIDPDEDGIFNTILGLDCGSEIASSVFSENSQVWLQIQVGSETLSPRIQIATVAYALNAETLQGFPLASATNAEPTATMGATARTVPALNPAGNLVIASASPKLWSTSGTFQVRGQALSIVTENAGNITIAPDTSGVLNLTFSSLGTGNAINAEAAQLGTSGGREANTLYYGSVANNNTNLNLLKLESGSSPTPKFTVDTSGNASAAGYLRANTTGSYFTGDITVSGGDITGANNVSIDIGEASSSYVISSAGFAVGGGTTYYFASTGNLNANAGTFAGDLTVDTNDFFVDVSENKIGLGTTTLTERLTLSGNATISGTLALGPQTQAYAGACNATTNEGKMYYDGGQNKYYYCNGSSWTEMGAGGGGLWEDHTTYIDPTTLSGTNDFRVYDIGTLSFTSTSISSGDMLYLANNTASSVNLLHLEAGSPLSDRLTLDSNGLLKIYNNTGANSLNLSHNGTNAIVTSSAGNIEIGSGGGDFLIGEAEAGVDIHFAESGNIEADSGEDITMTDIGNITPDATKTYNFGSSNLQWASLYAQDATLSGTLSLGPQVEAYAGACNAENEGKMYYDNAQDKYYYCNGSSWSAVGTGAGVGGSGNANYIPKWQDSSTLTDSIIYETGSQIGIGSTAPDAKLEVLAASGAQLRLEQTEDTNYVDFTVDGNGDLTTAPSGGDTNITGNLDVSARGAIGPNAYIVSDVALWTYQTSTVTSGAEDAIQSWLYANPSGASSALHKGIDIQAGVQGGNAQNFTGALYGIFSLAEHGGTGQVDQLYGSQFEATNLSSGTVVQMFGTRLNLYSQGASGTVNTAYSLYIDDPYKAPTGSIGTNYGIYIEGQTAASTDIGLYIADADTYSLQLASTDGDAASGITFGTDTNLYRSAANWLKTDDALDVAGDASTSGSLVFRGTSPVTIDVLNGGRLDFQTSVGGDVGLTPRITILNNGNVGIGTTGPSEALHVVGDAAITGALSAGDSTPDNHAWHVFGTGEKDEAAIADAEDVYVSGDLEVDGTIYGAVTGSISFANITSGTNTQAAMVVGTGASLTYHDGVATSGEINASLLQNAYWAAPLAIGGTTPAAGNFTSIGVTTQGTGAFTTLTSSGNSTIGTGASSINTIGSTTTPGTLTLHGATTLDNTFTVSGSYLTSLGGNLTVTGTAWTAIPTISGVVTMTSGFDSNAASTVTNLTIDGTSGTALNISNTGITTDISLQYGETIDNDVDGSIRLGSTTLTLNGTTTLTASSLATIDSAASVSWDTTSLTLGGSATVYGGSAASGTLTLVSTSDSTKGNLQFFSSSYYINSSGQALFNTDETINGIDINAGAVSDIDSILGNATSKFAFGGVALQNYNAISDSGTAGYAASDDDLYIEDILEVDGTAYLTTTYFGGSTTYGINSSGQATLNTSETINGLSISSASLTDAVNITMTGYIDLNTAGWIGISSGDGRLVFTDGSPDEIDVQTANLDLNNNLILNIGNAGTDFDSSGGLTLAGYATVSASLAIGTVNAPAGPGNLATSGTASFNSGGVTIDSSNYVNAARFVDTAGSGAYFLDPAAAASLNIAGYATMAASLAVGYSSLPSGPGNAVFSGNVGIGTTAPTSKLHVYNTDLTTAPLRVDNFVGLVGWTYKKPITITNSGSPLTNSQVSVTTDTQSLINATKMQSDCDDIRFTNSDGTTQLTYWLESGCNTTNTTMWVTVPLIPTGTKTIYMYYGNPSASAGTQTWSGAFILGYNSTCPSGWTQFSSLNSNFPRGSATYGGTGGASTHTQTYSGTTSSSPNWSRGGGGTGSVARLHTHTYSGTTDSGDHTPPYLDVVFCYKTDLVIPTNMITLFDNTSFSGQPNWTQFSALDGKFPRGSATYGGAGGTSAHTHTCSGTTGGPSLTVSGGATNLMTSSTHTHTHSGTTGSGDHTPPYLDMIFGQATAQATPSSGMITMINTSTLPPQGWTRFSALDGKFPRGNTTYGGTGGASTHTHTYSGTTSQASGGAGELASDGPGAHTHTYSGTTDSGNNIPPYLDVVFVQRDSPAATTSVGAESGASSEQTVLYIPSGSANVGIGTTSPNSKLGVLGNLALGETYGSLTAPTSGLIIEGNVGIGTTSPGGKLGLGNANTYLDVDGSNNLTFTDANAGTKTLTQLASTGTSAAATAAVTLTTTWQDVPGASLSLGAGTWLVWGVFDLRTGASTGDNNCTSFGGLDVGGTVQSGVAIMDFYYLLNAIRLRGTVTQVWRITLSATTTVKLQARKEAGSGTSQATAYSTITALRTGDSSGADVAEYYPTLDSSIEAGDVVSVDPVEKTFIKKSEKAYDPTAIGIIATQPGRILGEYDENSRIVALVGRVPTKVTLEGGEIMPGDRLTSSSTPGYAMKATKPGPIIGIALEPYSGGEEKIMTFVNVSWYDPDVFLTDTGDIKIIRNTQNTQSIGESENQNISESEKFSLVDSLGNTITRIGAFAELAVAQLKAGLIQTQELFAEKKIVSPLVETGIISPLPDSSDVTIRLGRDVKDTPLRSGFGKLLIQNEQGETVASIDSSGNASFAGQISADSLQISTDATVGGTLYADEIVTKYGKFGDLLAERITTTQVSAPSPTPTPELTGLHPVTPEASESALLAEVQNWEITDPSQDLKITSNLKVLGRTSLADTTVAGQLMVDASLSLGTSGINSLAGPLYLNSLGLGPVDILNGKVVIDIDGNVQVAGNLAVGGEISASSLVLKEESGFGKLLTILNKEGQEVASIDTEGIAHLAGLAIASDYSATQSATLAEIRTNATSGLGILPAGATEFTIFNSKVGDNTLVYITPVTSTQNKVLYVSAKKASEFFKVGIDTPIDTDIKFNWWIIN